MQKVPSSDGTAIAYESTGNGPAIVLLNGAFRDHTIFDSLVPMLTDRCTTYAYDRRGRGMSGDAPTYSIDREIDDLAAVIEAAGGGAVVFAGSCGANLALEAVLAGVPITKLALHEPFYRAEGYPTPPQDFADRLRALLADGDRDAAAELFLGDFIGLSLETIEQWRQGPIWAANEANAATLLYDTIICGDHRVPVSRLASVSTPSLVLNSEGTSEWLRAAAQATGDALPNGRTLELPGSWHRIDTEILARVLNGFVTT